MNTQLPKHLFLACATFTILCFSARSASAQTIEFGITGDAQLSPIYLDFGQFPNGAPYTPAPGYGTFEVSLVNGGVFSNDGLTTGEFGQIQSVNFQTGTIALPSPFIVFDGGASNLQLYANSMPAGTDGPLTFTNTPAGVVVSFDVDGYILDSSNPNFQQNFFSVFALTFAGQSEASLFSSAFATNTPFTATVSLTSAPLPAVAPAPEPSSLFLLGSGLLAIGLVRFRKRLA